jgi:hypothetical protein
MEWATLLGTERLANLFADDDKIVRLAPPRARRYGLAD